MYRKLHAGGSFPLTIKLSPLGESCLPRALFQQTSWEEEEKKRPATPFLSPVRKALKVIAEADFDGSPCKKGKQELNQAAKAIEDSSPEKLKVRASRVKSIFMDHVRKGHDVFESSETVMAISGMAEVVGSTIFQFVARVNRAAREEFQMVNVINLDHLTKPTIEGKRGSGFHFCPPSSSLQSILISEKVVNKATLVWTSEWEHEGVRKRSSFFPETIGSIEHLMWLLSQSEAVVSQENKTIRRISAAKNVEHPEWGELPQDFFVEAYTRNEGTVWWSIFPIFYYAHYRPDAVFHIMPDFTLTADEVLSILHSSKFKPAYSTDSFVAVDLSPILLDGNFFGFHSIKASGIFICFEGLYKALLK